jgi:hypothetical protein
VAAENLLDIPLNTFDDDLTRSFRSDVELDSDNQVRVHRELDRSYIEVCRVFFSLYTFFVVLHISTD